MSTTLKYRLDLDGIRASAVSAAIIFHIDVAWLPGGLLGVDIFFILSGCLITTIISREMQNDSFSLLRSYRRRAKRILPAFSSVLVHTTAVAALFFLAFDPRQYVKSAVSALLFSANLFFVRHGGYFDADTVEKPLQHIWSLLLEEQFYFVFPVLLIVSSHFSRGRGICQFILLLIALSLLSVFLLAFGVDPHFLPYMYAYGLLIGTLFAFIPPLQNNDRFSTPLVGQVMMAVVATMSLPPYDVLPDEGNIERLLYCTVVGGLIYSSKTLQTQSGFSTAKLLSLKLVVFTGSISYSLYLWHWTVSAVMRHVYMDNALPISAVVLAVVLMLGLSVLFYYFIETPARRMENLTTPEFIGVIVAYFILLIPVVGYLLTAKPVAYEANLYTVDESKVCVDTLIKTDRIVGVENQSSKVLLMSDPHAAHLMPFIDMVGKREGFAADVILFNSRGVAFGFMPPQSDRRADRCNPYNRFIAQKIENYSVVFISQCWFLHTDKPGFTEHFGKMFDTLTQQGKQVYVFADTPMNAQLPLRHYYLKQRLGLNMQYVFEHKKAEIARSAEADKIIENIVKQ